MTEAHLSERSGAKERVSMKAEVFLPDDYRPAEDEPFMNDRQLEYFRRKLLTWKQELLDQSADTIDSLQTSARNVPDIADRASEETDRALELRTRDRQRKLVAKIDSALRRVDKQVLQVAHRLLEPAAAVVDAVHQAAHRAVHFHQVAEHRLGRIEESRPGAAADRLGEVHLVEGLVAAP